MMKQLRHDNIVPLHEVIDDPEQDVLFLVMEFVEGGSIGEVDGTTGRCNNVLRSEELDLFVQQQLSALGYVHQRGMIHGDFKVENILFTGRRGVELQTKLCDFGVTSLMATAMEASFTFSSSFSSPLRGAAVVGTPYARSPEMFNGMPLSESSDAWAFGVALYTLAFGRAPFHATSMLELSELVLRPVPIPSAADPALVDRWWPTITSLLALDSASRLFTFRSMTGGFTRPVSPQWSRGCSAEARRRSIVLRPNAMQIDPVAFASEVLRLRRRSSLLPHP